MRRRLAIFLCASTSVAIATLALGACSAPASKGNQLPLMDDEAGGKGKTDAKTNRTDGAGADPPLPDGGKPPGRVYAHTSDTLYLFDPLSKKLSAIGKFACLEAGDRVLDIALDRSGNMYGTTDWHFISIDPVTGNCTTIKKQEQSFQYPNSLSFVPAGTVDPTQEALVGYAQSAAGYATIYTRINLQTGEMTDIDALNTNSPLPDLYGCSGDFVSLLRNGNTTYITVKQKTGDAGTENDLLAEVDPKNGQLKAIIGDIKQKDLFGFGYWAGTGYGFAAGGEIVEIDMATGQSTVVQTLADDGGAPSSWYGAGVTTDSPTAP